MYNQNEGLKIGLTFSGGGYRAACFCLGTLAYLHRIKLSDNKSLLEHVVVLSTVSGGTITGSAYAVGIKQGRDFHSIYKSIHDFIKDTDLVNLSIDRLLSDEGWKEPRIKTLINAFADVYDRALFKGAKFGTLMAEENPIHLKHISFNAAEFSTAIQFRFQWSELIERGEGIQPSRGVIGNNNYKIPEDAAREIRMADILASSSCFPGGFEPINFPTDFIYDGARNLKTLSQHPAYPIGIMDGGIVDNQGIEPVLLAEDRMKRRAANPDSGGKELDLIIISDVASPYMEAYVASVQNKPKGWRSLTPAFILSLNTILLLLSAFGMYWFVKNNWITWALISTSVSTITLVGFVLGRTLKNLPRKFGVPDFFMMPLGKLLRLRLQVYETLIANRKNSMLKLINDVFLKHVRRLNYNSVYEDSAPGWKNRRITNAIYELRTGEARLAGKIEKGLLPGYLLPSPAVQAVATEAASMGTTLWFTPDELKKKNMMNVLIACGQFTICWNLLEYIHLLKKDSENTTVHHQQLLAAEESMRKDWEAFNADPFWMVKHLNTL